MKRRDIPATVKLSDIPAGQPCPICGPEGHGQHEDDSYGACVLCREYVPHTDDETVLVNWPCPSERLRVNHAELQTALLHLALRRHEFSAGCDGCLNVRAQVTAAMHETVSPL